MAFPTGGGGGGINIPVTLTASGASLNLGPAVVNSITAQVLPALQQMISRSNAAAQAVRGVGSAAQQSTSGIVSLRNAMVGFSAAGVGAVYTVGAIIRGLGDLASVAAGIALRGITVLAAGFSIIKKTVLDATESFTRFRIQLEGITQSAKRAGEISNFVQEFAQQTPFATTEIEQIVKTLGQLPATADALRRADFGQTKKELTDLINTIQGLALLNPYGVEGAIIAFRNAVGGQLRSLELRLDIPAKAIAQSVGKSVDELKKGGPVVIAALKSYVDSILGADIIERLGDQLSVQIANIGDSFSILGRKIGESGFYQEVVDFFTSISDSMADFVISAEGSLSKFESLGLSQRISDALTVSFKSVTSAFQAAGAGLFGLAGEDSSKIFNASPIEAFARVVTTSLELIAIGLSKGAEEVTKFFTAVDATSGTTPFQAFTSDFLRKFESFGAVIEKFTSVLGKVISFLDKLLPLLQIGLDVLGAMAEFSVSLVDSLLKGVSSAVSADSGITGLGKIEAFAETFFGDIYENLQGSLGAVKDSLLENSMELVDKFKDQPVGLTAVEYKILAKEQQIAALSPGKDNIDRLQKQMEGTTRGSEEEGMLQAQIYQAMEGTSRIPPLQRDLDNLRQERLGLLGQGQTYGPPLEDVVTQITGIVSKNQGRLNVSREVDTVAEAFKELKEAAYNQRQELIVSSKSLSGFSAISERAAASLEESDYYSIRTQLRERTRPDVEKSRQQAAEALAALGGTRGFISTGLPGIGISNIPGLENFGVSNVAGLELRSKQGLEFQTTRKGLADKITGALAGIENEDTAARNLQIRLAGEQFGQSRLQNRISSQDILNSVSDGANAGLNFGAKDLSGPMQTFFETRLEIAAEALAGPQGLGDITERLNDSIAPLSERFRAAQEAATVYNTAIQESARVLGFSGDAAAAYAAGIKNTDGLTKEQATNLGVLGDLLRKVTDAEKDRADVLKQLTSLESVGRRLGAADQGSINAQIQQFQFDFAAAQKNPGQFNPLAIERTAIPELERLRSLSFDPETRKQIDDLIELADNGLNIGMPGSLEILEFTQTLVTEIGSAFEQTLGDAIFRALKDDKMTWEEFGDAIGDAALRSISDGAAEAITQPLVKALNTALEDTIVGGLFDSAIGVQPITAQTATIDAGTVTLNGPVTGGVGGAGPTVVSGGGGAAPVSAATGTPMGYGVLAPSTGAASSQAAAQSSAGAPLVVPAGTGAGAATSNQLVNSPSAGVTDPNSTSNILALTGAYSAAPANPSIGPPPTTTGIDWAGALPYVGGALGTINGIRGLTQEGGTEGARGIGNAISTLALPLMYANPALGLIAAIAGGTIASFAEGGEVDRPTVALVGEKGPEQIVPKKGGMTPKTAAMLAGTRRRRAGPNVTEDEDFDDSRRGGRDGGGGGVTIVNMIEPDRVTRQALENDPNIVVNPVMENIQKRGVIYRSIREGGR